MTLYHRERVHTHEVSTQTVHSTQCGTAVVVYLRRSLYIYIFFVKSAMDADVSRAILEYLHKYLLVLLLAVFVCLRLSGGFPSKSAMDVYISRIMHTAVMLAV